MAALEEIPTPKTLEEGFRFVRARLTCLMTGRLDIWAERYVHTVWSRYEIRLFDQWLANYADASLKCIEKLYPSDHFAWLLESLRVSLIPRTEYWKSESRRYVAEQEEHLAAQEQQQSPPAKRRTRPKSLCFSAAIDLLRQNPHIKALDFCRMMDRKADQYPTAGKYRPPSGWKVQTFYEQYTKRSNTVSRFLTSVRNEIKARTTS